MDWDLSPGTRIKRTELHERFGGGGQGGMSPSARTPNLMLFTDPSTGHQHGYFDRWEDGVFLYTGEGQRGDQQLVRGNKALLEHRHNGVHVRLFEGSKGFVTYWGELFLANDVPFVEEDAPETGGGPVRKVVVFRLLPGEAQESTPAETTLQGAPTVQSVPVQQTTTEAWEVVPNAEPSTAEAREQQLVLRFKDHLEALGDKVSRHKYMTGHQLTPLYNDLFNESRSQLIEAKGSVSRSAIRMAIGQLFDYRFFENDNSDLGVLLPERPRPDLARLLDDLKITVIVPTEHGFTDTAGGRFT
jgi:hypothetical protein